MMNHRIIKVVMFFTAICLTGFATTLLEAEEKEEENQFLNLLLSQLSQQEKSNQQSLAFQKASQKLTLNDSYQILIDLRYLTQQKENPPTNLTKRLRRAGLEIPKTTLEKRVPEFRQLQEQVEKTMEKYSTIALNFDPEQGGLKLFTPLARKPRESVSNSQLSFHFTTQEFAPILEGELKLPAAIRFSYIPAENKLKFSKEFTTVVFEARVRFPDKRIKIKLRSLDDGEWQKQIQIGIEPEETRGLLIISRVF